MLGRVLHRPALLPAPALAFRAAFGEMSRLLLTGQRTLLDQLLDPLMKNINRAFRG